MNYSYNIDIDGLFTKLGIGELTAEPIPLSGGHLHRVYKATSGQANFAVKAINPNVIVRPKAMGDYINSENIARIASSQIRVSAANIYNKATVQEHKGQYYLIYDFIYGECLMHDRIQDIHCAEIGRNLALLHTTDFSLLGLIDDYSFVETPVNWNEYLALGEESNAVWVKAFKEKLGKLYEWSERFSTDSSCLSRNTVISHGDLEPKNVMWESDLSEPSKENCIFIDWEGAGFIHPARDLIETALYWSKDDSGVSEKKFNAFIRAYLSKASLPDIDWKVVVDRGFGMLGWLEYSLRRSLGIECSDEEEQRMGTDHVFYSLTQLSEYELFIPDLMCLIEKAIK